MKNTPLIALAAALLGPVAACRALGTVPPAPLALEERPSSSRVPAVPEPAPAPAAVPPAAPAQRAGARRVQVFFSGHSLLDNPQPDWVELIAESRGHSLGWEEQIVLGSPIRVRTKGDDAEAPGWPGYRLGKSKSGGRIDVLAELAQPSALAAGEKYQRLLITERNDFLGTVKWEDTVGYLRAFHQRLVSSGAPGASTLLYQCWPEIDAREPSAWVEYVRDEAFAWQCVAAKVNQALSAEGHKPSVSVVPGGVALAELVERALAGSVPGLIGSPEQRLAQIFSDDVHLAPIGTYLLAAVHYGALFGESPLGAAAAAGVPAEMAPLLQQIAWDTLSKHALAPSGLPSLTQCRQRIAKELCPAYYRLRGKADQSAECAFWASADSPL